MTLEAWVAAGFEQGWIVASGCGAHDGRLLSPAGEAELTDCPEHRIDELENEILDRCALIVRLADNI